MKVLYKIEGKQIYANDFNKFRLSLPEISKIDFKETNKNNYLSINYL